jgi:aspartate dehydrogenase
MYKVKIPLSFGLIGCGAMGTTIADAFDKGEIKGNLASVYDMDGAKAKKLVDMLKNAPEIAKTAAELIDKVDFVIEAASQEAVRAYAADALGEGRSVLLMSVGALMDADLMNSLKEAAVKTHSRIYLPSGAVAGVDSLLAASVAGIDEVTLTTTKPPTSLKGVKYLIEKGVQVEKINKATIVYEGPASEAISLFPKNINVAAIISLASGANIKVRIIADPKTKTNNHEIHAKGSFGEITTKTANVPSPMNSATSYMAALSGIATLKQITESVKIGN